MPVTKSAKKALKVAKRRKQENDRRKRQIRKIVGGFDKNPEEEALSRAFSVLDRAVDHKVIHKNTASRLKSRLGRLLSKPA